MLSRVPDGRFREPIGEALRVVHRFVHLLGHVRFVCGVDPVFAGVHSFDGCGYGDVPHCCYPHHLNGPADRRVTTVVLPLAVHPYVVVHELGHALHERINFDHRSEPVTDYARTNFQEAFAEAFVARHYNYGDRDTFLRDTATRSLFRSLQA